MSSLEFYERVVQVLRKSLEKVESLDGEDIIFWLELCTSAISELEMKIQNNTLSRGDKQKFQTCMTHLSCMQVDFEQLTKRGGSIQQQELEGLDTRVQWRDVDSAFENRIKTGVIVNIKHKDILNFMDDAAVVFKSRILQYLEQFDSLKVNSDFIAEFVVQKSDEEKKDIKYFSTENALIFQSTLLEEWFRINIRQKICESLENFQDRDSGWSLRSIISLCINVKKYVPINGSSYIELPRPIRWKRAYVNVNNKDDECFKWAVLSALHPVEENPQRVNKYKRYAEELNFVGMKNPMAIRHIRKFELLNDISVNVYMLRKEKRKFEVVPCRVTPDKKESHVNLLMIHIYDIDENEDADRDDVDENEDANRDDVDENVLKYHYVWIKDLSRLLSSQISNKSKTFHCERCLHFFHTEDKLSDHTEICQNLNDCRINLPREEDKILKFTNYTRDQKVPFVIYADFECLLKPTDDERAFQLHEAYSIGYYMKCSYDDSLSGYKSYRRDNAEAQTPAEWFCAELKEIAESVTRRYKNPVPMKLSDSEELQFQRSQICHICRKEFPQKNTKKYKVRDHCHLTGA